MESKNDENKNNERERPPKSNAPNDSLIMELIQTFPPVGYALINPVQTKQKKW